MKNYRNETIESLGPKIRNQENIYLFLPIERRMGIERIRLKAVHLNCHFSSARPCTEVSERKFHEPSIINTKKIALE